MFDDQYSSRSSSVFLIGSLLVGLLGMTGVPAWGQTSITGDRTSCENRQAAGYPCENVDLMSHLSIRALGGGSDVSINDIWGWTDPETGNRYAIVGRTDGTAFVDVTNPTEPEYLGELPSHSGSSSWRDVKVYQNHAFIVSEASNHGMQVFDLTQLRSVDRPQTFSETAHYDRFSTAHNVVVNPESGYAYVVGITGPQDVPASAECGAGLHIVNVQTPTQPAFAGCFSDLSTGGQLRLGYTHDAQCVMYRGPDSDYRGKEICFNANESQVNIADVTNKENPRTITNVRYPNTGYTHQAWLTENQRYLLVDDETDELDSRNEVKRTRTLVFDVTDLDNPELVRSYLGRTGSSDHNQYVLGDYSYQANYKSGLRILDVSDPENPSEVAYFDTFPESNESGFEGAWSNYPYFRNGIVLVSSIGEGLFVLAPTLSPFVYVNAERQDRTALVEWGVSVAFDTRKTVLEHKTPNSANWTEIAGARAQRGGSATTFEQQVGDLEPGTHKFRVRHISSAGKRTVSSPVRVRVQPEEGFLVRGPNPNPLQGRGTLKLIPTEREDVSVDLYDSLGREVASLYEGTIPAGADRVFQIRGDRYASGVYFLRIRGESINMLRKVVVAR